jgi:hypothetical protein
MEHSQPALSNRPHTCPVPTVTQAASMAVRYRSHAHT